jgi:hypothetical protein
MGILCPSFFLLTRHCFIFLFLSLAFILAVQLYFHFLAPFFRFAFFLSLNFNNEPNVIFSYTKKQKKRERNNKKHIDQYDALQYIFLYFWISVKNLH